MAPSQQKTPITLSRLEGERTKAMYLKSLESDIGDKIGEHLSSPIVLYAIIKRGTRTSYVKEHTIFAKGGGRVYRISNCWDSTLQKGRASKVHKLASPTVDIFRWRVENKPEDIFCSPVKNNSFDAFFVGGSIATATITRIMGFFHYRRERIPKDISDTYQKKYQIL